MLRVVRADPGQTCWRSARQAGNGRLGAGACEQQCVGHRMGRAAQADGVLAAGRRRSAVGASRQDEGERTRPEGLHQPLGEIGHLRREAGHRRAVGDVDDQRVVAGPALAAKILATAASLQASAPRP